MKFFIYLLVIPIGLIAQKDYLTGYVTNDSKIPIIGASVYFENTATKVYSDVNGYFEIEKDSSEILIIEHPSYQKQKLKITNENQIAVLLKQKNHDLEEVKITIRKPSTDVSMFTNVKIETMGSEEFQKAACCNLSESFETNATIDVAYSDAVTGTKQIQMLGLSGTYALISSENIPTFTGNSVVTGLEIIPGQWLESVQLIKGTGSVINGYQSITGQINTEYKSPFNEEKGFYNFYIDGGIRAEVNWIQNYQVKEHLAMATFLQADNGFMGLDINGDGFADNLMGPKVVGMGVWQTQNPHNNWESRGGIKGSFFDKKSGQIINVENPYLIENNQERFEVWNKTGYVFKSKKGTSIGIQSHFVNQNHKFKFGNRSLKGKENRLYNNLIFETILNNTQHKLKSGVSHSYQNLNNGYIGDENIGYEWQENNIGAFSEYVYQPSDKLSIVPGARVDYSDIWGVLFTPRFHSRIQVFKRGVLRASAGIGTKNANPLLENIGMFVNNRKINSEANGNLFLREQAYNYGLNYTHKFKIDYRDAIFTVDFYRTDFINKAVVDFDFSPQEIHLYNLDGKSFANSFMAQFNWEAIKFLDLSTAYRYYEVLTEYKSIGLAQNPFTPKHRFFINAEYGLNRKWYFDATLNWMGSSRVPTTASNPDEFQIVNNAPAFYTISSQIRYEPTKKWEFYIGANNLFDFRQENPVISAENPESEFFDASLVWGPVFGRMAYFGMKFKFKENVH